MPLALYCTHRTLHTLNLLWLHHYNSLWCRLQQLVFVPDWPLWAGGWVTEYTGRCLHLYKNQTRHCKFRLKGCNLLFSTVLQHFSYQRVALYFNYTLPGLYVMFTLHSCIPLFCIHLMLTFQHRMHIGTGGAEWSPLVETIVLLHFDLPNRLVLERHLFR